LRYADSRNTEQFATKKQLEAWSPVDFYMIGPEHIVLHLLYSRFFTKFLRDEGYLNFDEPFTKMRHQGMILGPDHKKMSKSKGNVVNPDEIIQKFGSDTLRMYEMFMGPIESDKPWDIRAVAGMYRFLQRVHTIITQNQYKDQISQDKGDSVRKLHQTIQKVTQDIPALKYNTAIAAMMELMNVWEKDSNLTENISLQDALNFTKLVAPFAPFLAEELHICLEEDPVKEAVSIHLQKWPIFNPDLIRDEEVTIAIQVNGKVRAELKVNQDAISDKDMIISQAKDNEQVKKWLEGKQIKKEIYIPGKIVSIVVN